MVKSDKLTDFVQVAVVPGKYLLILENQPRFSYELFHSISPYIMCKEGIVFRDLIEKSNFFDFV
jgi:hypothetical protein